MKTSEFNKVLLAVLMLVTIISAILNLPLWFSVAAFTAGILGFVMTKILISVLRLE